MSTAPLTVPHTTAQIFTLPNGLTLIVDENRAAEVSSVQVWVKTGSIHEGAQLGAGMSHLLEHLMFKGTPSMGPGEFARRIQNVGGYLNAYTSFDRTVYWADVPAAGTEAALAALVDATLHSTLPEGEYDKEREVIRREFAMGEDDPDRVASLAMFATAFREHPFRHPVIGHIDAFNALSRDQVLAYYRRRYVPNNMFVVVVGAVNPDDVRAWTERAFADEPFTVLEPVFTPDEPAQLGLREEWREFPTELTRLSLAWHIPGIAHSDAPALDVLAILLGHGRSSRLHRKLREELGIAHSADAWAWTPPQPGLFGVDCMVDPANEPAARAAALAELERARAHNFTDAEIAKARRLALAGQIGGLTSMRGRASDLGSNWLAAGDLDFTRTYLAHMAAVSRDDLARVLDTYFREEKMSVTSLHPPGFSGRKKSSAAASSTTGVELTTLSNGLRLLVCPDRRLPLVSMVAAFRAGLLAETEENNGVTRLLARVLLKGTATRTAADIANGIESLGGSIGSDGGNNSIYVTAGSLADAWPEALDTLGDVVLNATLPEAEIAREKTIQLASIKAEADEPTVLAGQLLREHLYPAHPFRLRSLGTPESLDRLDRAALDAFRAEHLCARNGVLAIFGDVDPAAVRERAERIFSKLPAGEPRITAPAPVAPIAASEVELLCPKEQAVLMLGYHGADLHSPDRVALEFIEEACSDLGSRLFDRIREQMGLAYFVGASQLLGLARGAFNFYLGTDPARVGEVKTALREEIAKLAADGLTDEEIARARAKLLGQIEIRRQSLGSTAISAALDELYGLGHAHWQTHRDQIQRLTADEVRDAARRYFAEQPSVLAIVRP